MLTPRFSVTQDDAAVRVVIHCPYVKAQDVEVFVAGTEFRFHIKPYFLRLTFSHAIVDNDDAGAVYDAASGDFTVTLPKSEPGTVFENLDILSSLLAPTASTATARQPTSLIEECDAGRAPEDDEDSDAEDWSWQQQEQQDSGAPLLGYKYGFNLGHSNVFAPRRDELHDVLDGGNPDDVGPAERRATRTKAEDEHFSEDHYMVDITDNRSLIASMVKADMWWSTRKLALVTEPQLSDAMQQLTLQAKSADDGFTFTEQEKDMMTKLKSRQVRVAKKLVKSHALVMLDMTLAYVYDLRTTDGEHTVESAWTIAKLCSAFACVEMHDTIDDVLQTFVRRSLAYPLYRSRELTTQCMRDALLLLADLVGYAPAHPDHVDTGRIDKRPMVRILLAIKRLMDGDDVRWIFNRVWTDEAINWVVHGMTTKTCQRVAECIAEWGKWEDVVRGSATAVYFDACGWQLAEWESLALEMAAEEAEGDSDDEDADV
ncbi:hypothetical protein RI367_004311 [Sorochytrium milnesiophthora]